MAVRYYDAAALQTVTATVLSRGSQGCDARFSKKQAAIVHIQAHAPLARLYIERLDSLAQGDSQERPACFRRCGCAAGWIFHRLPCGTTTAAMYRCCVGLSGYRAQVLFSLPAQAPQKGGYKIRKSSGPRVYLCTGIMRQIKRVYRYCRSLFFSAPDWQTMRHRSVHRCCFGSDAAPERRWCLCEASLVTTAVCTLVIDYS